jgi:thymidine kinase
VHHNYLIKNKIIPFKGIKKIVMSIDVVDEVFFLKKRQVDHLEIFHEALHIQLLHSFYGYLE